MAASTQTPVPAIVHNIHQVLLYWAIEAIHLTQSKIKPPAITNAVYNNTQT